MHYTAMMSHINECPCHCQYCGTVAERGVISNQHMEKCNKFPVPCPNTCGKDKIPQDEMDSHKKECPLEMVWCEYCDIGCKTILAREKMSAHYRDEMAKHLQCMHRVVRQLQKGDNNLPMHMDNFEVVAEESSRENTEQITGLLNNQGETIAKFRIGVNNQGEAISKLRVGINEKHHNMMIILVSVLVLAFAVLMGHYDEKFALVTEKLHNLSTTGSTNQLHNDRLIDLLQKNVKLQSNHLKHVTKAIIEATSNMETLKHYLISVLNYVILELKPSAISLDFKFNILNELSKTALLVNPVLKYPKPYDKRENWTSSPFFAFDEGYQMCLKIRNYPSMEVYLMKGPFDDKLQQSGHWPLRGKFSISLFDQSYDGSLYAETKRIIHQKVLKSDIRNSRVTDDHGMVKIDCLTIDGFSSYNYDHTKYWKDGNMYFTVHHDEERVPYTDIYTLNKKLSKQKLSLQHALELLSLNHITEEVDDQVAPFTLKLPGFSEIKIGDPWYSSPFFAFVRGYQIRLKIVKDRDCLISLELFLMKGTYDEELQILGLWPLRGTFTVQVLGNNKYYPSSILLDKEKCTKCFKRVTENDVASEGFGFSIYTLDALCTEPDFFKDDALFFEIFYNKHTSYKSAA